MKLKYELSYMDVDGTEVAVPVNSGDEFRGVLHMNSTVADILKCLENDVTEDDIVGTLKKEYDATEEEIRSRVRKTAEILRENGLLCE